MNDYVKKCSRHNGGIRHLRLAAANDIASIELSAGQVTNIVFKQRARFAEYDFCEGTGELREEIDDYYSFKVKHTLSFSLNNLDTASLTAIEQLKVHSCDGIVALVTTNSGETLLVGYSVDFATERPLRLQKMVAESGQDLGDASLCNITLYGEDTALSMPYIGAQTI